MKYERLPELSNVIIESYLCSNSIEKNKVAVLSLGEYCEDIEYAQKHILSKLLSTDDLEMCGYCVLAFSYLARRFRKLDRNIVETLKSILSESSNTTMISEALEDIELFLGIELNN